MVKPSLPHHGPINAGTMAPFRSTLPIHGSSSIGRSDWMVETFRTSPRKKKASPRWWPRGSPESSS